MTAPTCSPNVRAIGNQGGVVMATFVRRHLWMPAVLLVGLAVGALTMSSSSAQDGSYPTTIAPPPTYSGEVRIAVQYHGMGEGGGQTGTKQLESRMSVRRRSDGGFSHEFLVRGRGARVWVWSPFKTIDAKTFTANVAVGLQAGPADLSGFAAPFAACASYMTSPRHITQPYIPKTPWWDVEVKMPDSANARKIVNAIASGDTAKALGIDLQTSALTVFECGSDTLL